MPGGDQAKKVISFTDVELKYDPYLEYDHRNKGTPIIIDNGTHTHRVGWANDSEPKLRFPSKVVRARNKGGGAEILVGNDIFDPDSTKHNFRSLHDSGIVTNYQTYEEILDHSFLKLGIDTDSIEHPVLMTETLCNPNYCRERMTELLLECYQCKGVSFGIDGLFSFYHSNIKHKLPEYFDNGIIISGSHSATYVLPVINGKFDGTNAKRLAYSMADVHEHLTQLTTLKYPQHKMALFGSRIHQIQSRLHVAQNYNEELKLWADEKYLDDNELVFQLPFVIPEKNEVSEEEKKQKREEQANRLKDYLKQKREKTLAEASQKLEALEAIKDLPRNQLKTKLNELGVEFGPNELEAEMKKLSRTVAKITAKILGLPEPVEEEEPKQEYVFDLLDVSDSELNVEQKKEKKKQRFILNAKTGRERAKKIREQMLKEKEQQEALLEKHRKENPEQYLRELYEQRNKLVRKRELRKKRKQELNNRGSQASKQRMRLIMQQAQSVDDIKGKRNKAKRRKQEENFGMDDADFDVYRDISKEDDSESEHEQEEIANVEVLLMKYDPNYKNEDDPPDIEEFHKIRISTEAIRVPEALFQPSLVGNDHAGLTETIEWILNYYSKEQRALLIQNVHVSGGFSAFDGFADRIKYDLTTSSPFGSIVNVRSAETLNSAWYGARDWIKNHKKDFDASLLTKTQFEEHGMDYLKESWFSNVYKS